MSFNQDECTLSYHRKGLDFYMFKIEFLKRYSVSCIPLEYDITYKQNGKMNSVL